MKKVVVTGASGFLGWNLCNVLKRAFGDSYSGAVVCRMPLMFGRTGTNAKSFIQPWIESLQAGKELTLFTDEYRTPVDAESASGGLILSAQRVHGIIHLGGRQRISRYDFGKLLCDLIHCDSKLIKPGIQKDFPMAAPRPSDVSLDSSKAFSYGYDPDSIEEALKAMLVI